MDWNTARSTRRVAINFGHALIRSVKKAYNSCRSMQKGAKLSLEVANHVDHLEDFRRVRFWRRLRLPVDRAPAYQRIAGLPEVTLTDLADYLDLDLAPDWPIGGLRLFVSHSAAARHL